MEAILILGNVQNHLRRKTQQFKAMILRDSEETPQGPPEQHFSQNVAYEANLTNEAIESLALSIALADLRERNKEVLEQIEAILATIIADIQEDLAMQKAQLESQIREMHSLDLDAANELIIRSMSENQCSMHQNLVNRIRSVM